MAHHFQNPDGVNINAEFGRLSHTPPPTDKDPQATWSSPRRKRGWAWVSAKHDRSSSGLDVDECKENCRPPALTRRKSIKNMFSSVRNGLLQYNQMPTGDDLKGCAQDAHQADTQLKPAAEKATEIASMSPVSQDCEIADSGRQASQTPSNAKKQELELFRKHWTNIRSQTRLKATIGNAACLPRHRSTESKPGSVG